MAKSKWFRWWMIPIVIVGGLAVTGVVITGNAEKRFQEELVLCQKAGLAVNANDLRKNPANPAENSAGQYQLAIRRKLATSNDSRRLVQNYRIDMSADEFKRAMGTAYAGMSQDAAIRSAIKEWEPVFAATDEATKLPRMDFRRQWEVGIGLPFPEFSDLRTISDALHLDAMLRAKSGDVEGAIKRLRQTRQVGNHCYDEPTLIGQLVGVAIHARTNTAAIKMLLENPKSTQLLERVTRFFDEKPPVPDFRNGFRGESYFLAVGPDQAAEDPSSFVAGSTEEVDIGARLLKVKWIRRSAQAGMLQMYREVWEKLPEDRSDWKATQEASRKLDENIRNEKSYIGKLGSIFAPAFTGLGEVTGKTVQRHQLARVMCALFAHKQKTGKYPATLPDMGSDSRDLFRAAPLMYTLTPNGFRLFSVGSDGKDDKDDSRDIGYVVEKGKIQPTNG